MASSLAYVADFRHSLADIGLFFQVILCIDEANIPLFQGLRARVKFGIVVAPSICQQGFVKLRWRMGYEK
jgi:hypothetical protein